MHWITEDWKFQDGLLDFIDLSGSHSGENLCNAFVKSCHDFGILSKVISIYSILLNFNKYILIELFII